MELFKKPDEAVIFALRFTSQQYAQSEMAKLLKSSSRASAKGLVGLDGAGQAGFVLARLERMDPKHKACVVARYSPRTIDCKCCGQPAPKVEYREAIDQLADHVSQYLSGALSVRRIRYAIVQEFFERRRSIGKVADEVGVPRRTAYDQKNKIWPHLVELDKMATAEMSDILADICGDIAD